MKSQLTQHVGQLSNGSIARDAERCFANTTCGESWRGGGKLPSGGFIAHEICISRTMRAASSRVRPSACASGHFSAVSQCRLACMARPIRREILANLVCRIIFLLCMAKVNSAAEEAEAPKKPISTPWRRRGMAW